MIPVADTAQMRECDRITIEELGLPGLVLMENASRAVAGQALDFFKGNAAGKRVEVFCGKGNNGGDGFAVARHLKNVSALVSVFLVGEVAHLTGDAKFNWELFQRIGGEVSELKDKDRFSRSGPVPDLIIDALLGTGIKGKVSDIYAELITVINETEAPVIAVDIPSGVDGDTGAVNGIAIEAEATVTFGLVKRGLTFPPGRDHCGSVIVADIGIPPEVVARQNISLYIATEEDARKNIPRRKASAHKGDAGHVYILAGSPGLTGAAIISAESAMRTGAGLVVVGVPRSLNPVLESKMLEAMSQPLAETKNGTLSKRALPEILPRLEWADVVVVGPGLGRDPETAELLEEVFDNIHTPLIVDADGLNILADFPHLKAKLPPDTILTPHPGEFSRLTGVEKSKLLADPFKSAAFWAQEWKLTLVLKGSPTLTASSSGRMIINSTGNSGMATGGSGDALTGIIAALIGQGIPVAQAAWTGVYIHGAAGDRAMDECGIHGMVAGDIIRHLPGTVKSLA